MEDHQLSKAARAPSELGVDGSVLRAMENLSVGDSKEAAPKKGRAAMKEADARAPAAGAPAVKKEQGKPEQRPDTPRPKKVQPFPRVPQKTDLGACAPAAALSRDGQETDGQSKVRRKLFQRRDV
ncbi:hypothetical protein V5799_024359 [Amblyomma americanum]|uniref:Uncharacterized protein n=1 Tax=Amblyomma americanum TaxID=6943 RepID=A0AAQ4EC88_AMBAM